MERALIERISRAVLYEGYVLYPYRTSSLKNAQPCTFGILYPEAWAAAQTGSDRSHFQVECILLGGDTTRVTVRARFLQIVDAGGLERQEAMEREVELPAGVGGQNGSVTQPFSFAENGVAIEGEITARITTIAPGALRLTVVVRNTTPLDEAQHDRALVRSLASAHAALTVSNGEFISMTDPPAKLAEAAAACVNTGVWPVLAGEAGERDTMLASPIILPDYPQVAPESAGDLYDSTEIDEILTLRILTLTDAEKAEVRASGARARNVLERAEALPAEHLMRLHGTIRGLAMARPDPWSAWDSLTSDAPPRVIVVKGTELRAGDRVRLRPNKRADIMDFALDRRIAVIAAIEQDFEDNIHVAVVVEDDPGRDLGELRQIGHRFFFAPSEIEPLELRPE